MDILSPTMTKVVIDFDKVHDVSVMILKELEAQGQTVSMGALGSALTLGRLISPEPLEPEMEVKFVEGIMDWVGMYFTAGGSN